MAACPTHRSWFTARNPAAERGTTGRTWSWLEKPELGPALMLLLGARYSWPPLVSAGSQGLSLNPSGLWAEVVRLHNGGHG